MKCITLNELIDDFLFQITGGSSGIGKAIAEIVIKAGANVTLLARNEVCNRDHHEILPPDADLVHASIKFALLAFFGDFTNKTKTKQNTNNDLCT